MTPTLTVIQSNWNLTGWKSVSASWNTGDLIVVIGLCENNDSGVNNDDQITTPTATGLTFSSIDLDTLTPGGDHCYGASWQATAGSSGSGTISTTIGNHAYGMLVVIAAAGTHNGVGGHTLSGKGTSETASVTVAGPHSAIVEVVGDWAVGDPTGNTYTPSGATGWGAEAISGRYTPYRVTWTDQPAGTRSYGANATPPGTPNYNKVIVEIKGIADAQASVPWVIA